MVRLYQISVPALVGGPGVVPGCNVGRVSNRYLRSSLQDIDASPKEYAYLNQACRHVAQNLMGTNKANPTAMILSATMMLRHLGKQYRLHGNFACLIYLTAFALRDAFSLDNPANNIASATFNVINEGKVRTADMGGTSLRYKMPLLQ